MIRSHSFPKVPVLRALLPLLAMLGFGMATAQAQRVGIVYSESSAAKYYDRFTYNQLFMSMQNQARMAGIPYHLLTEDDLTDINKLAGDTALIIPFMPNVKASKLAAIEAVLDQAVFTYHIGLITGGDLMTMSETGAALADPYARMNRWLGVTIDAAASGVAANLLAQNVAHPAMTGYTANETIVGYSKFWFSSYVPVAGQTATLLAALRVGTVNYNGVQATVTGGRNVHFASEEVLGDTNLAWPSLQWIVYGNQTPVGLSLGRMQSLFLSRNDMDQSMFADELNLTNVPLYDLLANWKSAYNFVGSYYLNVGNKPAQGEYTNWNISGPLYQKYLALGNEIGTHSWTHPDSTSALSTAQLEFEFNQSKQTIGSNLGITVQGAAIPGMPESLAVDQQLEKYFSYVSGRYGAVGNGFQGAIGRMTPASQSMYFSLGMLPDFTLIEDQKKTPAQAQAIWASEIDTLNKHASVPLIHWLWHDYAPTSSASLYTLGLFTNTLAKAKNAGAEFVTLADADQRMRRFETAALSVTGSNPITASVNAQGVGQFSLRLQTNQVISQVGNWYAYDNKQVFLPDGGGTFTIQLGASPANVSRITELPMRARLLSVIGDGNSLSFTFEGEGAVGVTMSPALASGLSVSGASSYTQNGNQLVLLFNGIGMHSATLNAGPPVNYAPVANNKTVNTQQASPVAVTLTGSDANGDALSYSVVTGPSSGQLSGSAPNLTYTPTGNFTGNDSFTFQANDGSLNSNTATVSITVAAPTQITFTSVAAEDGWLVESSETSNMGGAVNTADATNQAIRLGDDALNRQIKSILSFNTSSLPDNATILSLRLELTRGSAMGTDVFTTHGNAKVDIKANGFSNNKALQPADFQAPADATEVASFSNQGGTNTVYVIELGTAALSKVSLTNTTQLRLSLALDDNNNKRADFVGFHSGGSAANLRPRLIVTYR